MATEVISRFMIVGGDDFDPKMVEQILGIKPTNVFKIGDLVGKSPVMRHKDSGWMFEIKQKSCVSVEGEIKKLIKVFYPKIVSVLEIAKNNNLKINFSIVIYIENNKVPSMSFEPEMISKISEFNASVDIDVYCLT